MRMLLDFAEGPLFKITFLFMVLGLARLVVLSIVDIVRMRARTADKGARFFRLTRRTLKWLNPLRYIARQDRPLYTILSFVFHVGLIVLPIFLLGHVTLWKEGLGFGWWVLPAQVADILALVTIATGLLLIVLRVTNAGSRHLSTGQDWLLTPLCVVVFLSGYLSSHLGYLPVDYLWLRLIHVLSAELLFVLMPLTKLAHAVLLPFTQYIYDLGWRFVPGAGDKVARALGTLPAGEER